MKGTKPNCPVCGSYRLTRHSTKANGGRERWRCKDCGHVAAASRIHDEPPKPSQEIATKLVKSKIYVFTSAQNATPVHKRGLASLKVFEEYNDALLQVIPYRYKNATSIWSASQQNEEHWAHELEPYLFRGREKINANLMILGDIRTQPTAATPLNGLEGFSGHMSAIVGHPRLQLRCIPTPAHKLPKIMTTTGSITVENYTDTTAGKKGEFNHTLGACVVEVQGDKFFLRQINMNKDGSFIDLDKRYSPDGVTDAPPASALVMGDTHRDFVDPGVVKATFGKGGIVDRLQPRRLYWHDLLDFYTRNHHHKGDPFIRYGLHHTEDKNSVAAELTRALDFVRDNTPDACTSYLVPSNHPDALARWIREANWKEDPENAEFYLETALEMVRNTKYGSKGAGTIDPFNYWAEQLLPEAVVLKRDESSSIHGIECGLHGDRGPNGSKGSIQSFKRIGTKSVTAHNHSAGIEDGCTQVGTNSLLRLGYNTGPSSWLHSDCVIYANGKRSLLFIIEGEWLPKDRV